jgi:hypothetical protein
MKLHLNFIILLFSGLSWLPVFGQSEQKQKDCMEFIIAEDAEAGGIRNHASKVQSLSATINDYTQSLEALDFSHCPDAFTKAFKAHIHAWKDLVSFTDEYPELRGEMHDLFKEIEIGEQGEAFKHGVQKVWDSWAEVESHLKQ